MASKLTEGLTALEWGCPWHIWKGRSFPTNEDKAFMIAVHEVKKEMAAWEAFVNRPKD